MTKQQNATNTLVTSAAATALNLLELDPRNIRKDGNKSADPSMVASLTSKGLLNPLFITAHPKKTGKYIVKIGNRRLRALRQMAADGTIAKDYAVKTEIMSDVTDIDILEAQLAENMIREAMSPIDEFEAFAALQRDGLSEEDISHKFGTTIRKVRERLALGSAAPVIRDALRTEDISLDVAKVYAGCPDLGRQVRIFEALKPTGRHNALYLVRNEITADRVSTNDSLGQFVTAEAYEAAGGHIERDLITQDGMFDDEELLYKLRDEKLQAAMEVTQNDGWSWVEVYPEHHHPFGRCQWVEGDLSALTKAEEARCDELRTSISEMETAYEASEDEWSDEDIATISKFEEALNELEERENTYSDDLKAQCGVIIYPGRNGETVRNVGWKLTEKSEEKPESSHSNDNADKPKPEISQALQTDINHYRGSAVKAAMIQNPDTAFDYFMFSFVHNAFRGYTYTSSGTTNSPKSAYDYGYSDHVGATEGHTIYEAAFEDLDVKIFTQEDVFKIWTEFQAFDDDTKAKYIAAAFAKTILPTGDDSCFASQLMAEISVTLRDYWTPTFDNYFNRIRKDRILAHIDELVGADRASQLTNGGNMTKKLAAQLACDIISGKTPVDKELRASIDQWAPEGFDFKPSPITQSRVEAEAA